MRRLIPALSKTARSERADPVLRTDTVPAAHDDGFAPRLSATGGGDEPWAREPRIREPEIVATDDHRAAPIALAVAEARPARAPKPTQSARPPKRATQAGKRPPSRASRRAPLWKKRLIIAGLAAAVSAGLSLAAFVIVSDRPAQAWRAARIEALDWTARRGLAVSDIQAIGRKNTTGEDILTALGVSAHTPILGLDLIDAKRRIESLPWVASAEIERRLPNALRIVITEREPVAILQTADRSVLIDADGVQIVPVSAQTGTLPIVTGRGAAENVAELLKDLKTFPDLGQRVKAAVRVGDRRWDVKLDSIEKGIEVRLPEIESAAAWGRLSELDRKHRLLARDIALIDLRLPDRMVVRLIDGKILPPVNYGIDRKGGQSA